MPGPSVMSLEAKRAGRRVARARMVLYLSLRAVARAIQTMSRPGPKSTSENRRVRALLASLCALCCLLPLSSWAGRPVRVYEVDVGGQAGAAVQEAMRQAVVRAPGRRESADDPALASVLAEATRYVKSYAVGPRGESQVVFDGAAVEQAITAAGRSIWDHERPFTLAVLSPPRNRAAEDAARAELERVAAERGLPISLLPLTVVDGDGSLPARPPRCCSPRSATAATRSWWGRVMAPLPTASCSGRCTRAPPTRVGMVRLPRASTTRWICWCRDRARRSRRRRWRHGCGSRASRGLPTTPRSSGCC